MNRIFCLDCRAVVREIESHNLFLKHAACPECHTVYVLWGDMISRCETPARCTNGHVRYLHYIPRRVAVIIPGPRGMGML